MALDDGTVLWMHHAPGHCDAGACGIPSTRHVAVVCSGHPTGGDCLLVFCVDDGRVVGPLMLPGGAGPRGTLLGGSGLVVVPQRTSAWLLVDPAGECLCICVCGCSFMCMMCFMHILDSYDCGIMPMPHVSTPFHVFLQLLFLCTHTTHTQVQLMFTYNSTTVPAVLATVPFPGSCSAPAACAPLHANTPNTPSTFLVTLACLTGCLHGWQCTVADVCHPPYQVVSNNTPCQASSNTLCQASSNTRRSNSTTFTVTPLWSLQVSPRPCFAAPIVFAGPHAAHHVAAVAVDGAAVMLTAVDGAIVWRTRVLVEHQETGGQDDGAVFASPVPVSQHVPTMGAPHAMPVLGLHVGIENTLLLLPVQPRQLLWVSCLDGSIVHTTQLSGTTGTLSTGLCPACAHLCIGCSNGGVVYVLNTSTRQIMDSIALPGASFSGLCILQHQQRTFVVTGCRDDHVYCIECSPA